MVTGLQTARIILAVADVFEPPIWFDIIILVLLFAGFVFDPDLKWSKDEPIITGRDPHRP